MPTIKHYVREGLLPPGELTGPNKATYGEAHERQLRLIRALLDVGGMKVAEIADVLAALDDPADHRHVDRRVAVEGMMEAVAVGAVLGEAVFSALRGLAHVDASAKLYGTDGPQERKAS